MDKRWDAVLPIRPHHAAHLAWPGPHFLAWLHPCFRKTISGRQETDPPPYQPGPCPFCKSRDAGRDGTVIYGNIFIIIIVWLACHRGDGDGRREAGCKHSRIPGVSTFLRTGEIRSVVGRGTARRTRVTRGIGGMTEEKKGVKRGLASADEATRKRVAKIGGTAPHTERGLQAASRETRRRVARAGGRAPHEARGLQAANVETRKRVARAGGRAPHEERGLQAAPEATRKRVSRRGDRSSAGPKRSR